MSAVCPRDGERLCVGVHRLGLLGQGLVNRRAGDTFAAQLLPEQVRAARAELRAVLRPPVRERDVIEIAALRQPLDRVSTVSGEYPLRCR